MGEDVELRHPAQRKKEGGSAAGEHGGGPGDVRRHGCDTKGPAKSPRELGGPKCRFHAQRNLARATLPNPIPNGQSERENETFSISKIQIGIQASEISHLSEHTWKAHSKN